VGFCCKSDYKHVIFTAIHTVMVRSCRAGGEARDRWEALAKGVDSWGMLFDNASDLLRCGSNVCHFDSWFAPIPAFKDLFNT